MNAPQLDITWDPVKAQSNITKHNGVTFVKAATVLLDAVALTVFDAAHSEWMLEWLSPSAPVGDDWGKVRLYWSNYLRRHWIAALRGAFPERGVHHA